MRTRGRRALLLGLLTAVALLVGGCVYLRLLKLKFQFGDFDRNFVVDTRDGLALTFKNPVLLDDDIEQFFKWVPDARQRSGLAEKWHFAWVKKAPPDEAGLPPLEVGLDLYFTDHKLVKLSAPEKFFAVSVPKSLALGALHSLGHAKVDEKNREAKSTVDTQVLQSAAADKFLSRPGLLAALGRPLSQTVSKDGHDEWHYEFVPVSTRQRFGDSGVVDINFTLDPATGKVLVMQGHTMFGGIVFDTRIGPGATGTMNTALPRG